MPIFHHQLRSVGTSIIGISMGTAIALSFIQPSIAENKPVSQPLQDTKKVADSSKSTPSAKDVAQSTSPTLSPGNGNRFQQTPLFNFIEPISNPLQFPTKPSEVRIQQNEAITLKEALELARRHNRDLQVAAMQLERSRKVLREALAAEYPDLTLNANVTRSDNDATTSTLQPSNLSRSFGSSLELSYNLYTSGRRQAQVRAAERQVRSSELELERISEQIRLDVTNTYYNLQNADEQVRISQAAVNSAQQSLRDTQNLEKAGVGTRFDTLRAQVQLANEVQNLTNARRDRQIAQRTLAERLSLAQSANLTAADPVQIAGIWDISLEQSIVMAYKNRAELEQQLVQKEIGEQNRRVAIGNLGPQINVFARYNVQDGLEDDINPVNGYALGARLSWNLYDGGASRARAQQAEKDKEIAETRFANLRNQVRLDVETAFFQLQSNFENIQTATVALEQAKEALRLARLRFKAGVGTQTEVINAETDLTTAEGRRVQAVLGYNRALAALQRAITNLPINP